MSLSNDLSSASPFGPMVRFAALRTAAVLAAFFGAFLTGLFNVAFLPTFFTAAFLTAFFAVVFFALFLTALFVAAFRRVGGAASPAGAGWPAASVPIQNRSSFAASGCW